MNLVRHSQNDVVENIRQGLGRLFELVHKIGITGALGYALKVRGFAVLQGLGFEPKRQYILLRTKDAQYPLYARDGTSDLEVFEQIFVKKEYSPLTDIASPRLIIDCGAYVGYSTIYFLNKFPNVKVIAVEPDSANFAVSEKNLVRYGDRVQLFNSGIWCRKVGLVVVRGKYLDGREWATQVRECTAGEEPDVFATDIMSLIKKAGVSGVDLLKIDIEGSERVLFADGCDEWLDQVRNIVIELHDEQCRSVFFHALSRYNYDLSRSGELIVCKNLNRKNPCVRETND